MIRMVNRRRAVHAADYSHREATIAGESARIVQKSTKVPGDPTERDSASQRADSHHCLQITERYTRSCLLCGARVRENGLVLPGLRDYNMRCRRLALFESHRDDNVPH